MPYGRIYNCCRNALQDTNAVICAWLEYFMAYFVEILTGYRDDLDTYIKERAYRTEFQSTYISVLMKLPRPTKFAEWYSIKLNKGQIAPHLSIPQFTILLKDEVVVGEFAVKRARKRGFSMQTYKFAIRK